MFIKAQGFILLLLLSSCASIWATRPSQQMMNMEVAIRAAKEVSADTLAPELFRLSNETAGNARREYRLKNFKEAREFADQARVLAEKAEFESIRNGGKREATPSDPLADSNVYPSEPIASPTPLPETPAGTAPAPIATPHSP